MFSNDVAAYVAGHSLESWPAEPMRLDARLRKRSLIGEAATRVPDSIRERAEEIPRRRIVGTRNRLMHAYPATDLSAIWSIVTADVPGLQSVLRELLVSWPEASG